jgi:hypothetical protein
VDSKDTISRDPGQYERVSRSDHLPDCKDITCEYVSAAPFVNRNEAADLIWQAENAVTSE